MSTEYINHIIKNRYNEYYKVIEKHLSNEIFIFQLPIKNILDYIFYTTDKLEAKKFQNKEFIKELITNKYINDDNYNCHYPYLNLYKLIIHRKNKYLLRRYRPDSEEYKKRSYNYDIMRFQFLDVRIYMIREITHYNYMTINNFIKMNNKFEKDSYIHNINNIYKNNINLFLNVHKNIHDNFPKYEDKNQFELVYISNILKLYRLNKGFSRYYYIKVKNESKINNICNWVLSIFHQNKNESKINYICN